MREFNVKQGGQENYKYFARSDLADNPAFDCLTYGHILMRQVGTDEFATNDGLAPVAEWCLWCGSACTNELIPED